MCTFIVCRSVKIKTCLININYFFAHNEKWTNFWAVTVCKVDVENILMTQKVESKDREEISTFNF